jgi:hypothetical protein
MITEELFIGEMNKLELLVEQKDFTHDLYDIYYEYMKNLNPKFFLDGIKLMLIHEEYMKKLPSIATFLKWYKEVEIIFLVKFIKKLYFISQDNGEKNEPKIDNEEISDFIKYIGGWEIFCKYNLEELNKKIKSHVDEKMINMNIK